VQFAKLLGATDEELAEVARKPLAEVIGFPRTMTHYCRKSAAEGLATWWGDEKQLPEAHGATALALKKYYRLSDETIEYFYEHVRADIEHTEHSLSLFEGYVKDRGDVVRGRRAAAVTLWPGGKCMTASCATSRKSTISRLHAIEAGAGPLALCLHGVTANAYVFEPLMTALAARFRVVSLDQRGHGRSPKRRTVTPRSTTRMTCRTSLTKKPS